MKALGDEEHVLSWLVLGVRGTEDVRWWLGVEGTGVLYGMDIVALGVLGVWTSFGAVVRVGDGVVERAMVAVSLGGFVAMGVRKRRGWVDI